jgi:hypothetical protein
MTQHANTPWFLTCSKWLFVIEGISAGTRSSRTHKDAKKGVLILDPFLLVSGIEQRFYFYNFRRRQSMLPVGGAMALPSAPVG